MLEVKPEIVPTTLGVEIVTGIVCNELVDKFVTSNVISPLHLPANVKLIPTGTEKVATPESLIGAVTAKLSEYPASVVVAVIQPLEQAKGFDATNPGVWCHRLDKLMDIDSFTSWDKYNEDKMLK